MRLRRRSIAFRLMLAVAVPAISLLVAVSMLISSSHADQLEAETEADRLATLAAMSEVQAMNMLPELAATHQQPADADSTTGSTNYSWNLFSGQFLTADNGRIENTDLSALPDAVQAAMDAQRLGVEVASAELETTGLISQETVDRLYAERLTTDQALYDLARLSDTFAWTYYSTSTNFSRAVHVEANLVLTGLLGSGATTVAELEAASQQRHALAFQSLQSVDGETRVQIQTMLDSYGYAAWLQTVEVARAVIMGEVPPAGLFEVGIAIQGIGTLLIDLRQTNAEQVAATRYEISLAAAKAADRQTTLAGGLVALLGLTVLGAWAILRSITFPLRQLTERAAEVAEGNVTGERLLLDTSPELGRLNETIESLVDGLRHLDKQVRSVAAGELDDQSLSQPAPGPIGAFIHSQIEQLRDSNNALRGDAFNDPLTGLLNRRGLLDVVETLPNGGWVLYLDLDGFKLVNDDHGHEHGDKVLATVAERLRTDARADDVVARIGGDEFVVLLSHDNPDLDRTRARILSSLARPISHDGVTHTIGCSIGVARFDAVDGIDTALRKADLAMLERKMVSRASREAAVLLPNANA